MMVGSLAHLWPDFDSSKISLNPEPGYLRTADDGSLTVAVLEGSDFNALEKMRSGSIPDTIAAATEQGGTLLADVWPINRSFVIGGTKASTSRYRARLAVVGFSVDALNSSNFQSISLFIPGISEWAGVQGSSPSSEKDPEGRVESFTTTVRAARPSSVKINRSRELELSTHWEVTGPNDHRIVYAPTKFTVRSTGRLVDWSEFLDPLLCVQDLANLAFKGFVAADGGEAALDMVPVTGPRPRRLALWSHRAMVIPKGGKAPRSMNEIPTFYMQHIGGIEGIRRWIHLNERHPRATGPLISRFRHGMPNAETHLTNVAIAIEYWVNTHGRTTKWASYKPLKLNHAERLARHIGAEFKEFVGDEKLWAKKFWDLYGDLKHNHKAFYSKREVHLLAESGTILLECALLNRVAGNKIPSRAICRSHRNDRISSEIKDLIR